MKYCRALWLARRTARVAGHKIGDVTATISDEPTQFNVWATEPGRPLALNRPNRALPYPGVLPPGHQLVEIRHRSHPVKETASGG
jgi:hypothetical protein